MRFFTSLRYVLNDRYLSFIEGENWGWEEAELPPTPNSPNPPYDTVIQSEAKNLLNLSGYY